MALSMARFRGNAIKTACSNQRSRRKNQIPQTATVMASLLPMQLHLKEDSS